MPNPKSTRLNKPDQAINVVQSANRSVGHIRSKIAVNRNRSPIEISMLKTWLAKFLRVLRNMRSRPDIRWIWSKILNRHCRTNPASLSLVFRPRGANPLAEE